MKSYVPPTVRTFTDEGLERWSSPVPLPLPFSNEDSTYDMLRAIADDMRVQVTVAVDRSQRVDYGGTTLVRDRVVLIRYSNRYATIDYTAVSIILAHELGHIIRYPLGDEQLMRAREARPRSPGQTYLIMAEEVRAWRNAEDLLGRCWFKDWAAFGRIRHEALLSYDPTNSSGLVTPLGDP